MHITTSFVDAAGWIGAILILVAYALNSSGKLESRSLLYQWMNILGAIGLIINSGWNRAWPSVGLNVVWFCIAVHAVTRGRVRAR
jgi:hypothetical protein